MRNGFNELPGLPATHTQKCGPQYLDLNPTQQGFFPKKSFVHYSQRLQDVEFLHSCASLHNWLREQTFKQRNNGYATIKEQGILF